MRKKKESRTIDPDVAASIRDWAGGVRRYADAHARLTVSGISIGKECVALGKQLARPSAMLIDSFAAIMHGSANVLLWAAERVDRVREVIGITTASLGKELDMVDVPTIDEVSDLLTEAMKDPVKS